MMQQNIELLETHITWPRLSTYGNKTN